MTDDIRARYAAAATAATSEESLSCACGPAAGSADFGASQYSGEGLADLDATASLGCGNPLAVADLQPGDVVLDLGSGAGLDVLLSSRRVGPEGRAYGLDMTDEMLALARANAAKAGATNVEFLKGQIEQIPLPANTVDVVISNCVVNLSTDKATVLKEAHRVLKPGGRLGISDVVADDGLDPGQRQAAEQRVGCVHGTLTRRECLDLLQKSGFIDAQVNFTHQVGDGLHSATVKATAVQITAMTDAHAKAVLRIYQAGIDGGDATFETAPPSWEKWRAGHLDGLELVALNAGKVIGWAAAGAVSDRCVYAGVAEHSLYIDPAHRGRGVGRALLEALITASEDKGIWTLQSGIFPENGASLALHEHAGFRVVGVRQRVGRHHDRWRDVIMVERRSLTIGL
jgi:L-amino acid N-acyltransferase YncA/2-polyprenyl-3-methyl-5-hydroxy-6-metoxy-1,4-benzoquinol methylase